MKNKDRLVNVRVNDEEEAIIKSRAKAKGISVSQFIREACHDKLDSVYNDKNSNISDPNGIHLYGNIERTIRSNAEEIGMPVDLYIIKCCTDELRIKNCEKSKEEKNQPRNNYIQFTDTDDSINKLKKCAEKEGISLAKYVRETCKNHE